MERVDVNIRVGNSAAWPSFHAVLDASHGLSHSMQRGAGPAGCSAFSSSRKARMNASNSERRCKIGSGVARSASRTASLLHARTNFQSHARNALTPLRPYRASPKWGAHERRNERTGSSQRHPLGFPEKNKILVWYLP